MHGGSVHRTWSFQFLLPPEGFFSHKFLQLHFRHIPEHFCAHVQNSETVLFQGTRLTDQALNPLFAFAVWCRCVVGLRHSPAPLY